MNNYCYNCMNEIQEGEVCKSCFNQGVCEPMPHHLRPGQVLNGKYLVGNCIGEGGFGITYVGKDMVLDIKVAIKEFFPNGYVNRNNCVTQMVTATTEEQKDFFNKGKDRFLAEAKNIAKFIDEPGVVGVREYFEANGTAYIIMEYLDGINLSKYIRVNGKMAPDTIFKLMLPIMSSLQRVHEAGIIHRDISPDNIMYMKNGTLKLMDFGSARYFTNEEKEMSIMLKQGYAPEEQYRKNSKQGPWTDVYGLCATMYRCITGVVPDDALDRIRQDNLKAPSKLGVEIKNPLEIVLMYGLAVFKENRCQNMTELSELTTKALSMQEITVNQTATIDITKTMAVDSEYKTQVATIYSTSVNTVAPQPVSRPVFNQPTPAKTSTKMSPVVSVILIISIAALIIVGGIFIALHLIDGSGSSSGGSRNKSDDPAQSETKAPEIEQITMPSCENEEFALIEEDLIDLGFVVNKEEEFSEDVEKGYIISQSIKGETSVDIGTEVTLVVSKGPEECPYDYEQKLVVSAAKGSTSATATLYEWEDGEFKEIASYKATVGSNGIGVASEGSSTTPSGLHKLGVVLSAYSVDTNMNTYKVTKDTGVVYETTSSYYNIILERDMAPSGVKFDNLGKSLTDGTTYATIYIEHNGSGFSSKNVVPGKGSAIGIRGQYGSLSATYGDVDISSDDMIDLLSKLDYYKNPMIEIKVK